MGYRVTAPLVQARRSSGSHVHVYEGGFLPDDIDPDQLEQLQAAEMIEEADVPEDPSDETPSPRRGRKAADQPEDG